MNGPGPWGHNRPGQYGRDQKSEISNCQSLQKWIYSIPPAWILGDTSWHGKLHQCLCDFMLHVPNFMIYSMTKTEPPIHHVRNRQLRFLGQILLLPEEESASRYALYIPPHGNRRPGRPCTSYLAYCNIQRLLVYEEGSIHRYKQTK